MPTPSAFNTILAELERQGRMTVQAPLQLMQGPQGLVLRILPNLLSGDTTFWAKITGNLQDSSNFRWKYAWSEVTKTTAGFSGWTVLSGGRSGTTTSKIGYNTAEDMNGATGLFGNGVTSTNLTGTLKVQPVSTGVFVKMTPILAGTTQEYHFTFANGVDGGC